MSQNQRKHNSSPLAPYSVPKTCFLLQKFLVHNFTHAEGLVCKKGQQQDGRIPLRVEQTVKLIQLLFWNKDFGKAQYAFDILQGNYPNLDKK